MQKKPEDSYNRKSRGILFNFNKCLKDNNLNLKQLCFNVFSYEKERFTKAQFTQLIREIDERLSYEEIDHLIENLDPDGNGYVFFNTFQKALQSITEADDPFRNSLDTESSKIMTKSRISKINESEKAILLLKDIKDRIKGSDPYQLLDLFDRNRDGNFDYAEFDEFTLNYGITDIKERVMLRKQLYGDKSMLTFKEFIKLLELQAVPKRVRFEDLQNRKSHIISQKKIDTKTVKPILKKNASKNNIKLEEDDVEPSTIMPSQIAPYVNSLSQLQEPLQSMAVQCIRQKAIFTDKKPAAAAMAHHYEFASNIFGKDYTLFSKAKSNIEKDRSRLGPDMFLDTKDAMQGAISSQYLISSIASLVHKYPEVIYRNFVLLRNPASIYGIKLFIEGRWKTIITDAFFPVDADNKLVYARSGGQDIWILLIEKAMAKVYRAYENVHMGLTDEGLNVLTGAPVERFNIAEIGALEYMKQEIGRKSIICVSGSRALNDMSTDKQSMLGLSTGRAYTVLDIFKDVPSNGKTVTLIKLKYPEGKQLQWNGDWSFDSNKWTSQLKSKLGYDQKANDRCFFMEEETFKMFFGQATTCFINPSYINSYIRIFAARTHSHMLEFTVKTQGDYFLSIYQDGKRKFSQSHNFEKSKARLFLASIQNNRLEAYHSKAVDSGDLHQEFRLKPGMYIMSCKVKWKFFEKYHFVVTSYGPDQLKFKEIPKNKEFLPAFIKCKAMVRYSAAKKQYYKNIELPQSFRAWQMLPRQGFGYILISNPSDKTIESTLNFTKCEGIKALKPQRFPLIVQVAPNQIVVRGLLVDPSGYNYVLDEKRRIVVQGSAISISSK